MSESPTAIFYVIVGLALLLGGGEVLVRSASRLATILGMSPLIIGLTVVAFCTSAPEVAVSVVAAWKGQGELAVGNIVGSCICNILLILGTAAAVSSIAVSTQMIRREIPQMVMVGFLIFGLAVGFGAIPSWCGPILLAGLCGFVTWSVIEARRNQEANVSYTEAIEQGVAATSTGSSFRAATCAFLTFLVGLGMLLWGSDTLVYGATVIAKQFGVSERVIGLTILAIGTSLPELVVSVLAATRNQADLAIGNVVGSNLFNLLGVLGPAAIVAKGGLTIPDSTRYFDLPIMCTVFVLTLYLCFTDRKVSRKEGLFLLGCYIVYLGFLARPV